MKGFETGVKYSPEILVSVSDNHVVGIENYSQQIDDEESLKLKKNDKKFNLLDITKTYGHDPAENRLKGNKKNLSKAQRKYYQEFLDCHPDWKALDEERQNSDYQKKFKRLFADVKEILKQKSRKS